VHRFVGQRHMGSLAVGIAVHRDRGVAEFAGGTDDAAGDLAPVGNQDFVKHRTPLSAFGRQSDLRR
jgi:hypothetical protein